MKRNIVSGIVLTLLLISIFTLAFDIQPVESDYTWTETIYIRADGSVDPDTAPISSDDNITYTLTDHIVGDIPEYTNAIVIERENIVIDGTGYAVQGTGAYDSIGIDLSSRSNVTIKRTNIKGFSCGVYLNSTCNSTVSQNDIAYNGNGIKLYGSSNNSFSGNIVTNNGGYRCQCIF